MCDRPQYLGKEVRNIAIQPAGKIFPEIEEKKFAELTGAIDEDTDKKICEVLEPEHKSSGHRSLGRERARPDAGIVIDIEFHETPKNRALPAEKQIVAPVTKQSVTKQISPGNSGESDRDSYLQNLRSSILQQAEKSEIDPHQQLIDTLSRLSQEEEQYQGGGKEIKQARRAWQRKNIAVIIKLLGGSKKIGLSEKMLENFGENRELILSTVKKQIIDQLRIQAARSVMPKFILEAKIID